MSRSAFTKTFGASPSSFNVKETDMEDENKNVYKGVLLKHPLKPWVEYELVNRKKFSATETIMPASRQMFEEQARETMEIRKMDGIADSIFLQKLTKCDVSVDALIAKTGVVPAFMPTRRESQ
jgi:hypothetical protein